MAKLRDPDPPSDPAAPPPAAGAPAVNPAVIGMLAMLRPGEANSEEAPPPFLESPEGPAPTFPTVERQWPFLYVFDPNRWDVIGGAVVPQLYKLKGSPGANGVQRTADGQVSTSLASQDIHIRGHLIIRADVDGPRTSYLRRWQVGYTKDRKTGRVDPLYSWHSKWETLYMGSPNITTDTDGYVRWLLALIERRVLPQPSPFVFDRLESDYSKRVGQYLTKDPQRAEHHARCLAAVRAAKDKAGLGVPAKPAEDQADPGLL